MRPVLEEMGLLRGKHVGMDTSARHANASMRGLTNRMTEEKYRAHITRLVMEDEVQTKDPVAINRFDRKRLDRKTSNKEWENPHHEKIGRSKLGITRRIKKPGHTVDMEGAAMNQWFMAPCPPPKIPAVLQGARQGRDGVPVREDHVFLLPPYPAWNQ